MTDLRRPVLATSPQSPTRRRLSIAVLVAWGVVSGLGLSSLGASHSVALSAPTRDATFASAAVSLVPTRGQPTLLHVIDPGCSCTRGLLEHLLARGPLPGLQEHILFSGEDAALAEAATRAGFGYRAIARDTLEARLGLEVAPVLVALDAGGALRYVGGYFDHPAAKVSLDTAIVAAIADGRVPQALPVYGCATSDRLRRTLDPLGIVYSAR